MLENLQVVFGSVASSLKFANIVEWTHEGNELVWYDPVQISIFNLFIILVLLVVEFPEFIPS